MNFGLWSNGFRPHTSPAATYEEDLQEIILADQLGFRDCYISEHHGEPLYIDKVDTLPVPELLMTKAAALTKQIRMGSAVRVIHLTHPVDTAIQAAVTDHLLGKGRYIFGFGSGFHNPLFSTSRGLSYDDRHERLAEALELIQKCWTSNQSFDWEGKHWPAKNICATPRPLSDPMPMATATQTEAMVELAAQRGYTLLTAHEPAHVLKQKTDKYVKYATAAGQKNPLANIANARFVYITPNGKDAVEDLREAVTYEMEFQRQRGLLKFLLTTMGVPVTPEAAKFDDLVKAGLYLAGSPDFIAERLTKIYKDSGGFGTLLLVTGKSWANREKRLRSMRLFMEQVAPHLRDL
jgi:limonene 1,2-monooxygenase